LEGGLFFVKVPGEEGLFVCPSPRSARVSVSHYPLSRGDERKRKERLRLTFPKRGEERRERERRRKKVVE